MPKLFPVIWTPRSQRDVDLIHEEIAADRPIAADRVKRRLVEMVDRLADYPEQGRVEGRGRVLVTIRPYVVRYRIEPEGVVIVGVRHGARRPLV